MLSRILRKIESGNLEFSAKEFEKMTAYGWYLLPRYPELLDGMVDALPQEKQVLQLGRWLRTSITAWQLDDVMPEQIEVTQKILHKILYSYYPEDEVQAILLNNLGSLQLQILVGQIAAVSPVIDYLKEHRPAELMKDFVVRSNEFVTIALRSGSFEAFTQFMKWFEYPEGSIPFSLPLAFTSAATRHQTPDVFLQFVKWAEQHYPLSDLKAIGSNQSGLNPEFFAIILENCSAATAPHILDWIKEKHGRGEVQKLLSDGIGLFSTACEQGNLELAKKIKEWVAEYNGTDIEMELTGPKGQELFSKVCSLEKLESAQLIIKLLADYNYDALPNVTRQSVMGGVLTHQVFATLCAQDNNIESVVQFKDWVEEYCGGREAFATMLSDNGRRLFETAFSHGNVELVTLIKDWIEEYNGRDAVEKMLSLITWPTVIYQLGHFDDTGEDRHKNATLQVMQFMKEYSPKHFADLVTRSDSIFMRKLFELRQIDAGGQMLVWLKELSGEEGIKILLQQAEEECKELAGFAENVAAALLAAGMEEFLPLIAENLSSAQQALIADSNTSKHVLWHELGGENSRWQAIFNQEAPYKPLSEYSPYRFSGKVYDGMLPLLHLASQMEDTGMEEAHAYKLAVLFSSPQEAERYIDRYASEWAQDDVAIVHDAMLFEIPQKGEWNPNLWKGLVLKYGPAASKYLGLAPKIEAHIAENGLEFPTTPAQLIELASMVSYDRASEHKEFAYLAHSCGLSEQLFNEGLGIIQNHSKTHDLLPDVFIDGADIGHPNFYMEKLAASDPRGLLLGELTNCCQHLGDAGRDCAIHGFTSENGGFYVWKHKTKGQITPGDTIVAQSWAWRGHEMLGNDVLVFDSFERLSEDYVVLLQPFMEQFAHDTQQHSFPSYDGISVNREMVAVHLGKGGNTPNITDFRDAYSVQPVDYNGYRDSGQQYVVPARQHRKEGAEKTSKPSWQDREDARRLEAASEPQEVRLH